MCKNWIRMCSMLLVIVMLTNMLPVSAFATGRQSRSEASTTANGATVGEEDVYVLDEVVQNRTKYSKEFRLSNGLNMATVYASAVHYENEGHWEEIDNTLKLSTARSGNVYTNTAGSWQVAFPQNLTGQTAVTITKDGYTLSFYMSGELQTTGNEGTQFSVTATENVGQATYILEAAQDATAEIQEIDTTEMFANAQFEETVMDKLVSCLRYDNVYENTDIVYKLDSMQVKESIIMEHYDEDLRGYSYILDIGEMEPVLTEANEIQLYDKAGENLVMLIPMPYLVDSAGEYCHDVEVCLEEENDYYVMSYILPQSWLADEERSWPVILDPIVQAEATKSNIVDQNVYSLGSADPGAGVIQCGWHSNVGISRGYLKYDQLPELSTADVIVSATIRLCKAAGSSTNKYVEVHKVTETWTEGQMQWATRADYDKTIEDYAVCKAKGYYYWDITEIARDWYATENTGMLFKMPDSVEEAGKSDFSQFWSADYDIYQAEEKPQLIIMFRNNNGLESYWDYTSSSAGRAGTGYINNYTGNLVWIRSDIGFGGNRMPVVISHIYNANDSTNNLFGMGNGWRTNFNQRVYQWSTNPSYYVWEDSDGTSHYFLYDSANTYKDEDGLELTLTTNESGQEKYCLTDKYGNRSFFDTFGRLTSQVNNQATPSSINISYVLGSDYLISTIEDGVGREYLFEYNDSGLLEMISYQKEDEETQAVSYVAFSYTGSNLISITDKDGEVSTYSYTTNSLLESAQDIDGYTLEYTYNTLTAGLPNRVQKVVEKDGDVSGGELTITYAQNQTTFTDVNQNVQILQFNNWGNVISVQDDQGRARYARYATDDAESTEAAVTAAEEATQPIEPKGNQLTVSSKLQNTVGNVLKDSSFENGTNWTAVNGATRSIASGTAYIGSKSQKVTSTATRSAMGVASESFSVAAGETYTFSAYIKAEASTAYLALHDGTKTVKSEVLAAGPDWRRLEVSYTAASAVTVTAQLMTENAGTIYMDCVQVEKAPTASRYNLIENGDFRHTTGWTPISGRTTAAEEAQAPALELSADIYKLHGSMSATNRISQTVNVSGEKGHTFILAGWGKGDSAPLDAFAVQDREFGLILTFNYTDNTTDTFRIHFNPYVDTWQYAASPMVAKKAYSSVTVEVAYDYNVNTAYFDGIQLYKEEFGTSYTYDGEGNIISVIDLQGQETEYEYTDNNLTKATLPTGAKLTYTYDDFHNVVKATTETGVVYEFGYDAYGNNTSVSITSGENTITSTATYTDDFNRLLSTTDATGKTTTYSYNADTNVLEWVQYPEDTEATRTNYTYDSMYRLASAAVTTDTGSALTANYTYDNDLLIAIQTASTTYNFTYGDFALRTSIKVGSQKLASYEYTNKNNYLQKLEYGNEHSVQYTYDKQGRVTQEKYEDGDTVTYKYDNSGALATVTDSATGITTTYYYDFTDRLMKYVESDGINTHSVGYEYDAINNLTKLVETINGVKHETSYTYDLDNRLTSITNGSVIRTYDYDGYSRVSEQVTKHGDAILITNSYGYRNPTVATTTGQIASLGIDAAGYDVTYSYTYDGNGNILTVSDGTNTTSYVYDSANQLLRENNQAAGKTWTWVYDNAGNILSKAEYEYTTESLEGVTPTDTVSYAYGNSNWGDLLTNYDGIDILYDEIGNPLSDGTWVYTWKHGRVLSSIAPKNPDIQTNRVSTAFIYNANGLRTRKTVTVENYHIHNYTITIVDPTCTEAGYTLHECSCGDSYQDSETAAIGHTYTDTVIAPTCTQIGYTLRECECGHSYQDNIVAATGHNYTTTVVAPTCTESGYTVYTCACGDTYRGDSIAAAGHNYTTTVVAPTCIEGGYTIYTCTCGDTYQSDITAATGHTYITTVVVPTCTEGGYTTYTCACGDTYQGDITGATGHTYATTVIAPTCTEGGYTLHECECGDSYQDSQTAALGHDYTPEAVEGGTQYTCTRCDASYLEAHVHSYTSTVVAPTCTEGGYTLHECECGDSYQDSQTAATGHTYTSTVVAPTCTEGGHTVYTCACGDSYQGNETAATGHTYTSTVIAPTCTEGGHTVYTCACGHSYQGNETAATGHTYTSTVIAPTCTEGGHTVYTCACGHSYQGNETAATGHTYTSTVIAPTCTTAGYTLHECACGDSYQSDQVAVTDHTYTITVVEPTCIAAGYTLHECECGDNYRSDSVAALGHKYVNSVCTRCGNKSLFGPGITKPDIPIIPGIGTTSTLAANGQASEATIVQIYDYIYNGSSLTQMTITTTVDGEEASVDTFYFAYASGTPMSVTLNGETYFYVTNLQGDVVAMLDADGVMVVEYTYDAWGNPLTVTGDLADTLGQANPLRYRGYVYDTESELYYLQSRYYDADTKRFISADMLISTGQGILGNNMFAYCRNNPVNRYDVRGYSDSKFEEKNDDEVETAPGPNDGGGGPGGDGSNSGGRVGAVNSGNGGNQNNSGKGFKSFSALKNYLGSAGSGKHWHHIVEQCQKLKSGFTSEQINNTSNVVAVDAKTHAQITGYYNRKDFEFTNGLSVRNWLAGQPYEVQYDFGLSVLQGFGVIP